MRANDESRRRRLRSGADGRGHTWSEHTGPTSRCQAAGRGSAAARSSAGHTGKVTRRRWLAEMALRPSSRTGASYPAGRVVMSNRPLRRCWRVIDDFDYVLTLVGPVLDAPAGPATETRPDQQRAQ